MRTCLNRRSSSRVCERSFARPHHEATPMFAHHLESAVIGADSLTLDDISRACWKGFEEGVISEADATAISEAVQARRLVLRQSLGPKPPTPALPKRREPRSPDRVA